MQKTGSKFEAPNGLQFVIDVQAGCGVWRCLECAREGVTGAAKLNYAEQAQRAAVEHSYICPAQRGH